eukprot:EG_transcript_5021
MQAAVMRRVAALACAAVRPGLALGRRWQSGPPSPPDNCCGGGCPRCVWDVYYEGLAAYKKQGQQSSAPTPPTTFTVVRHFATPNLETAADLHATRGVALVPVVGARPLTRPGHPRPVLEVLLDVRPLGGGYELGDHILLHAPNPPDVVERLARRLGYPPDSRLEVNTAGPEGKGTEWKLSGFMTAAHLLGHHVDISSPGVLRNSGLLQALLTHCADSVERKRLQDFAAQPQTLPPHHTHSLLALLEAFPSCAPPLSAVLAWLKPLLPRCYSVSSSPLVAPDTVSITFTVCGDLHGPGRPEDRVGGLCTSYLQRCVATAAPALLPAAWPKKRPRVFVLPEDPRQPLILCAMGSGIAPIKAMLDHRAALLGRGTPLGPCGLYYGCATDEDVLYSEDLQRWLASGVLTDLQLTFSHGGQPGATQYVWQRLLERGPLLLRQVEVGAVFYVCGSPEMQQDVALVWEKIAQRQKRPGPIVESLQSSGRYRVELWT